MTEALKLPVGIEDFAEIRQAGFYYVDKTNLIANIINEKVVLYTRPRRFGKTLNMSMLYYFFSIKEKDNAYLFDYLNISKNKNALKHQNKYPTIFISLKEMKNSTFDAQVSSFGDIIKNVILQNKELLESVYVDESDRIILQDFRFLNMLACLCTLKTAYTKHLKYVKRKIETKRGAVEIQRRNRNKPSNTSRQMLTL